MTKQLVYQKPTRIVESSQLERQERGSDRLSYRVRVIEKRNSYKFQARWNDRKSGEAED